LMRVSTSIMSCLRSGHARWLDRPPKPRVQHPTMLFWSFAFFFCSCYHVQALADSPLEGFLCSGPCHVGGWVRTPSLGGDMDLSSRGYGPVGGGYRPDPFTVPSVQKTGFSRSGSGTCSGNTWGTRHVPCSLFPVPLRIPPLKKRFILLRPCCAFASLDSDLFPVPCSLFPEDPTERTCVPCSLFPYSLRENPSLQKTVEGSGLYP